MREAVVNLLEPDDEIVICIDGWIGERPVIYYWRR